MSALRILEAGLFATVQDLGRPGHQRIGVPVSGALDPVSHRLANALVGNDPGTAAIEMRFLGPSVAVEAESVRLAVVGAEIAATVERGSERIALAAGHAITLRRNDRLRIGALRASSTATLAVAGGIDVAPVLGSRATFTRGGFGGLGGRALVAGDRVPLARARAPEGPEMALPEPLDLSPPARIRVVPGPQADHFTEAAMAAFLAAEWRVSRQADRMGLRLEGPEIEHRDGYNIVSDGIVTGAIQVPGSRQPIVLLADRHTSGGYPKIATVITADLPALGRLAPGATIRFAAVGAAEGAAAARARAAELARIVARLRPWRPPGAVDEAALWRQNLIEPPHALDGPD